MTETLKDRLTLLLVTDRRLARRPLAAAVTRALAGGVTAVMLREKDLPTAELVALGAGVRDACRAAGALFIVNRDIEAAHALGADGVHLSFDDMSAARSRATRGRMAASTVGLVGRSTHDLPEVDEALHAGSDYLVFGPVYDTPSKHGILEPRGPGRLGQGVRQARGVPVLAIGGVTAATAASVRGSGAAGIACIAAILDTDDETAAAAALRAAWADRS